MLSLLRCYLTLSSNRSEKWTIALGFTSKEKKKFWPMPLTLSFLTTCLTVSRTWILTSNKSSDSNHTETQTAATKYQKSDAHSHQQDFQATELSSHFSVAVSFPALRMNILMCPNWIFPDSSDCKESACNVEDPGLIPGSGRFPWRRNGYSLLYSCLGNLMDREAWRGGPQSVRSQGVSHGWEANTN